MTTNGERRARWIEIAISIIASIVTSALVVSWSLSATLSQYGEKLSQHDRQYQNLDERVSAISAQTAAHGAQIAVTEAHFQDLVRRLEAFEATQRDILKEVQRR
jgi:septal ring factor EnvC (AmiA/AmiB activator)